LLVTGRGQVRRGDRGARGALVIVAFDRQHRIAARPLSASNVKAANVKSYAVFD
jgi:hypothetical protein